MDKGAHYRRCDLQVHTPRDPAWSGPRPTSDEDRAAYGVEVVEACRKKGLQAVAITEHHDLAFVDFIRDAAAAETDERGEPLAEEQRLVVFPGLELNLAVPCQALLLFDADLPSEKLHSVLSLLGVEDVDESAPKHGQADQLDFGNLAQLHTLLETRKWLRGRFALLPNVGDGAHGGLLRKGMQKNYRDMPCVGGYVDGDIKKIGKGNRRILAGEDKNWGNKRLAVIQTSDARSSKFGKLGRYSTWIKWATPTAEALRQACLAQESRISLIEPELPGIVITELRVSNSKFMGPVDLELNPQYNALIGGRGTGKSTCLEYLRWALCDQPSQQDDEGDMPDHAQRRDRLIGQTLEPHEGKVEVHFVVNAIPHLVRRDARSGEVTLRVGSNTARPASPEEIRGLLPIEAYSQRQLSSVSVRVDELTRFVEAPIRDTLDSVSGQIEALAADTRENFARLQRHRALTKSVSRDLIALDSLSQQAKKLRESLGGLSEQDQKCLAEKPGYDEADHLVEGWLRHLEVAQDEVESLRVRLTQLQAGLEEPGVDLPQVEVLEKLRAAVAGALERAQDGADAAADALGKEGRKTSATGKLRAIWERKLASFQKRYGAATKRSSAHASRLDELRTLESRQREQKDEIARNREELASLGEPVERNAALRRAWHDLHKERSLLIEGQCKRLTEFSDGLIKATLRRSISTKPLQEALRTAVRGTNLRRDKIERFMASIAESEDPLAEWQEAMAELDTRVAESTEPVRRPPPLRSKLDFFGTEEIDKVVEKISAEQILELSLMALGDQPVFEYRTKEGEYIEFADASAGQQATALLRVLLNQGGPPLIIDQPEDDLDSQVILEVVDQIREAKHRRQLIFSSHNANLVVNGDAELVVCCDYRKTGDHSGGKIKHEGAIDIPKVRDEITVVMEGGKKAFRLRKDKYGF